MDRELSSEFLQKEKLKNYGKVIAVIVLIIIGFLGFRSIIKPTINSSILHTAIAETGPIEATITASGTVVPEFEQVITSSIQSKVDSIFHRAGEHIKSGESIISLNKEFVLISYNKLKDEYELKQNKKNQLKLNLERQLIDIQARYDIQKLKIESLRKKMQQEKRLFEIGAGSKNEMEKAVLDLEIAKRELIQLQSQINNQQLSLIADLKSLDLEIHIQKRNMDELKRQIELAEAKAEKDGVITWVNENIGSTVNKGDVIARIADLNSFKVEAKISDMHVSKLQVGNPVNVRINETDLRGTISNIRPTIENGVITCIIKLEDKKHELLRSNLRVDVYVVTSYVDNVVRVKNGPYINGSGEQDIFVIEVNKAIRKTVNVGATNFDYVEMTNEIQPGDKVIISNMQEYIHHKEIEIE